MREEYNKQQELKNCTFVKTILMIIIVFYHSILFFGGSWLSEKPVYTSNELYLFAKWLNSFHIYAFTFVSGYIFFHVKEERGGV